MYRRLHRCLRCCKAKWLSTKGRCKDSTVRFQCSEGDTMSSTCPLLFNRALELVVEQQVAWHFTWEIEREAERERKRRPFLESAEAMPYCTEKKWFVQNSLWLVRMWNVGPPNVFVGTSKGSKDGEPPCQKRNALSIVMSEVWDGSTSGRKTKKYIYILYYILYIYIYLLHSMNLPSQPKTKPA